MSLSQDIAQLQSYLENSSIPLETIALALNLKNSQSTSGDLIYDYSVVNYSGTIASSNIAQDLTTANPNCDRITIQNLDSSDILLVGIGEDAVSGRSYEIEPRGVGVVETGEANKRISVSSSKVGLKFVAIGNIRQLTITDGEQPVEL